MGILRIVCLLVFSLLLSLGNASAAGWTAGPGLTPSDDFPLFKTVEKRLGLSTAKIPHSGKELPIEFAYSLMKKWTGRQSGTCRL